MKVLSKNTSTKFADYPIKSDIAGISEYLIEFTINCQTVAQLNYTDASFRLAILKDLANYYKIEEPKSSYDESLLGKFKLTIFGIVGIAYHLCNGFAGGASILSLFLGIPAWGVLAFGLFLSLIYLILFFYIDLATISNNLKIKFFSSSKILDVFISEAKMLELLISGIKARLNEDNLYIIKFCQEQKLAESDKIRDPDEIQQLLLLLKALNTEQSNLAEVEKIYERELNRSYLKISKLIFPICTDILFFSYGFFTGQAMIPIISAAFHSHLAIISVAGIAICIGAGLASLLLYWLNNRLNVENLIGIWVGLDLNKVSQLPKSNELEKNKHDLNRYITQSEFNLKIFHAKRTNNSHDCPEKSTELSTGCGEETKTIPK